MGIWDIVRSASDAIVSSTIAQQERVEREVNRKIRATERKIDKYDKEHGDVESKKKVAEAKRKLNEMKERTQSSQSAVRRRTDYDLEKDNTGLDKKPRDYQYRKNVSLSEAIQTADSCTGVYILYLNGQVMKCGRATYGQGVRWRFVQYYNLNYDDRARRGDLWSVTKENRDSVMVSWQCCPVSKCKELEYKLFAKYGKGPWGLRAPAKCPDNSWELLI